mmetsp:Transcript_2206/g.5568  ORF Transcript_2206/g.5568 Transcript_2206/m.5568 type:complete len:225 (-) Transcript_2206:506-1180(-)
MLSPSLCRGCVSLWRSSPMAVFFGYAKPSGATTRQPRRAIMRQMRMLSQLQPPEPCAKTNVPRKLQNFSRSSKRKLCLLRNAAAFQRACSLISFALCAGSLNFCSSIARSVVVRSGASVFPMAASLCLYLAASRDRSSHTRPNQSSLWSSPLSSMLGTIPSSTTARSGKKSKVLSIKLGSTGASPTWWLLVGTLGSVDGPAGAAGAAAAEFAAFSLEAATAGLP